MRLRSRRLMVLTVLTWACLMAPGLRADEWPVVRGPSREPAPYRYDSQQVKQAPKAFLEDTAACILYSATTHLIEPDGTVETISHEVTRLNGRKAVEGLGEYRSITYDPVYQTLTLNEARVIKPGGQVVRIEPRHVQLRDVGTDFSVYEPDKQLVISFPNLEVGDVFEVKWTTRGKSPEYAGHFFTRYTFGDVQYPVLRDELRMRLPKEKPLKFAAVNGKVEPIIRDEGKTRLYSWSVSERAEMPQDTDLPSKEELRLQVMCSTFASWEEVGLWKQKLRADCWKCTKEVRDVVAEVTRGLATPREKAKALTYWVRRHIRYVSIASAHHGYTPHAPAQVIENLYGDCKDQAQLLAVMLREAGVPVALVTLGAQDDGQIVPEVPSPWGTHAILLVQLDGHDHWIDTTCTLAAWDLLPRSDRNRVVYVTDDKSIRLMRTPPLSADRNRYEQVTHLSIRADGTSHLDRTLSYEGVAALVQREAWVDVPAGERRRLMSADLQDSNSRSRLSALRVDEKNLRDLDQPVRARVEFDIPEQFGDSEHEATVSDSRVWNRLLGYSLDYERQTPLELGSPFESVHRYLVQLPAAFRFESIPKNRVVSSAWGSFRATIRPNPANPRWLEVEFRTRLEKGRVEPADFGAFRKFQQDLTKHWRVWLSLTVTKDLADALPLEVQVACDPSDVAAALVLARIYQHNNRMEDARRVLQRARVLHPDDAGVWELTVATAANLEETQAAYHEMVRRFPNERQYAVALGATCVRRGDHVAASKILEPLTRGGKAVIRGQAHYQLARAAFVAKDAAGALKQMDAARAAEPESVGTAEALRFQGEVHEQLGQPSEAIRAYLKALQESADNREVLLALIRLEMKGKQSAEALDHLRRYTLAVREDLEGLIQAADLHLQMGRLEDAFELAQRARALNFHAGTQRLLGLVHLERGDHEKAVFHLDRAGQDAQTLHGLIRANLALGKLPDALTHAKMVNTLPDVPLSLRHIYTQALALGDRKLAILKQMQMAPTKTAGCSQAVDALVCAELAHTEGVAAEQVTRLLNRAFVEGVDIGPAYALRGLLGLEHGRLAKALADAERALALSPNEGRAHYVRGRVRLERGHKDAVADLARAAEVTARKDAAVLHWLAAAQWQTGRQEEALATQRQAVELRPQDQELLEQLREFERQAAPKR